MIMLFMAAYVAIAAALAYYGRHTRIGPVLLFLVGLFVTPIVPAIYVLVVRIEQRT
ncbi:MAG: hypothetical protein JWP20_1744 [Roseomonas sp.]|jgi:hypothetical protein|nr:hypothetical protein [Roseomonas sp.]